jgi:hypothetical protein
MAPAVGIKNNSGHNAYKTEIPMKDLVCAGRVLWRLEVVDAWPRQPMPFREVPFSVQSANGPAISLRFVTARAARGPGVLSRTQSVYRLALTQCYLHQRRILLMFRWFQLRACC